MNVCIILQSISQGLRQFTPCQRLADKKPRLLQLGDRSTRLKGWLFQWMSRSRVTPGSWERPKSQTARWCASQNHLIYKEICNQQKRTPSTHWSFQGQISNFQMIWNPSIAKQAASLYVVQKNTPKIMCLWHWESVWVEMKWELGHFSMSPSSDKR